MAAILQPDMSDDALIRAAEAWLPTLDPQARAQILDILRQVAATGADPIASLRSGLSLLFGPKAPAALPATTARPAPANAGLISLEPLAPLRRPTMWPQRPKRLPNELFSSWLWRSAVAAGMPPRRFAKDIIGDGGDDIDRDVAPATLRRLATLSGQTPSRLAGGTLTDTPIGAGDTDDGVVEDALLRDGRFLLTRKGRDRQGRPRGVLQYCPCCLHTDAIPHFRRRWRFAAAVICVAHACRLHTSCWTCGAAVAPLAQRMVDTQPCCPVCASRLCDAPVIAADRCRPRQRALDAMLVYLAVAVTAEERLYHLNALAQHFGDSTVAVDRTLKLAGLAPSAIDLWFGQPVRPEHAVRLKMLARSVSLDRLDKTVALHMRRARYISALAADDAITQRRSWRPDHAPMERNR